jgi:molybdopterin biosynthesis enzyme
MVSSSKRIEVIADDEEEIVEAARRMVDKYDWVVTSGGIGEFSVHFLRDAGGSDEVCWVTVEGMSQSCPIGLGKDGFC